jgi:hypothetical protein
VLAESARMMKKSQPANVANRTLVSLAWVAARWSCSRETCRRVLQRAGVVPLFLGGDSRNATLRFDVADVLRLEDASQSGRSGWRGE